MTAIITNIALIIDLTTTFIFNHNSALVPFLEVFELYKKISSLNRLKFPQDFRDFKKFVVP